MNKKKKILFSFSVWHLPGGRKCRAHWKSYCWNSDQSVIKCHDLICQSCFHFQGQSLHLCMCVHVCGELVHLKKYFQVLCCLISFTGIHFVFSRTDLQQDCFLHSMWRHIFQHQILRSKQWKLEIEAIIMTLIRVYSVTWLIIHDI